MYINGTYTGEVYNGVRQGRGVLELSDGSAYMGYFKDNLPNGLGVIVYADG